MQAVLSEGTLMQGNRICHCSNTVHIDVNIIQNQTRLNKIPDHNAKLNKPCVQTLCMRHESPCSTSKCLQCDGVRGVYDKSFWWQIRLWSKVCYPREQASALSAIHEPTISRWQITNTWQYIEAALQQMPPKWADWSWHEVLPHSRNISNIALVLPRRLMHTVDLLLPQQRTSFRPRLVGRY